METEPSQGLTPKITTNIEQFFEKIHDSDFENAINLNKKFNTFFTFKDSFDNKICHFNLEVY